MAGIGSEILRKAEAPREARAALEEIQDMMALPWLPFPWAAYARRPAVLELFWGRLRGFTANDLFLRESLAIAAATHMGVSSWYRPASGERRAGLGDPQLDRELDAFEYGNPQLLIQHAALTHLLAGRTVGQEGRALPRRSGPPRGPEIEYPSWEELDASTQALVRHVRHAWSLAHAVPDILALAKWPRFLEHAWEELRVWRLRPEYRSLRNRLAEMAEDALERLRPRTELPAEAFKQALQKGGEWPEGAERVKDQVLSFTLILPGMILDNALLRRAAEAWREKSGSGKGRA
jgi:hypothetical protein